MVDSTEVNRRIVCAACRDPHTKKIILGPRHFDKTMRDQLIPDSRDYDRYSEQGFIDQYGVYHNREEAYKIAKAANQIIKRCGGDDKNGGTLYSENLY